MWVKLEAVFVLFVENILFELISALTRPLAALIGTHQEKNGALFWSIVTKLPLQGHPIVCWKFAQLLHKVLREGHPQVGVRMGSPASVGVCVIRYRMR